VDDTWWAELKVGTLYAILRPLEAEEAVGLDTHQGQRPCPSTIALEASRRRRHSGRKLRRTRDGGSQFDEAASTERTRLAAGEKRERRRRSVTA
jgi:hypothetical protein